jgi:hypothetical protein
MKSLSKALLYANSHHDDMCYILEAEASCQSFKQYIDNIDGILYCDLKNYKSVNFDQIKYTEFAVPEILQFRMHKRGQMLVKHQAMLETEYDYNLVLGSDTYALSEKVNSIFELLEKFDMAVAHAPIRITKMEYGEEIPVPESFPEFNCDIIAYRKNDKVLKFIELWGDYYRRDKFSHLHDQGTFRYLLYNSDLRVATLTPEFNYRGSTWSDDTVILQNRELLKRYIANEHLSESKPGFIRKAISKLR